MPLPFFVVPFVMAAARVALAGAGRAIAQSAAARAVPVIAQTASRAASSVGNAARAAGPLTTVGAGVTGLSLTASSLGVVPQRTSSQSSSSQSSSRSNQPRSGGPAPSGGGGGGGASGNPVAQPEVPESTSSGEVAAEPASGTGTAESAPTPVEKVVKSANIETILFNDEEFSSEFLVDLLFESVAGQELLTIARNDTVNGQDVVYQPIKNLNILQDTYNPTRLLAVYDTSDSFFGTFAIDLRSKIPSVGTGADGKNYYLTDLGDLVIEVANIANDEQVEFQVADSGTIEELGI
jgi:hypothetical protein